MSTLERDIKSENKTIVQGQNRDFFFMYAEEHKLLQETIDKLCNTMRNTENEKLRFEIAKYLSEQIMGKAQVSTDITSGGDRIQTVLLDIFKDDPKKDQ
jgi:hypothetical protein